MKPVKMAFIGTGGIAQAHLRALEGVEEIDVVAVADIIKEKAVETAERFDIPEAFEDYHDILEMDEVEAVNVTTFNQAHRGPTVDALEADKHVIVEKPMAATLEDATAMARAAKKSDKLLMVALKTRYSPHRIAAKQIVDAGTLGDIYYAEAVACRRCGIPGGSFVRKESAGIGTVADIGVYALDEILHLMGHPKPVEVLGIANNILGTRTDPVQGCWRWVPDELEVEDFGVASVRFENDAMLTFKTSWIMHMDSMGGNFLLGTEAGLRLNPLTVFRHEFDMLTDTTPQVSQPADLNLFREENVDFARAIREGRPSPIPADEMLLTNVIIQGLIDSAEQGGAVKVEVPEL